MRVSHTVGTSKARFIRMKSTSKKRTPSIVNLTVERRYLTQREIERLMANAAAAAVREARGQMAQAGAKTY